MNRKLLIVAALSLFVLIGNAAGAGATPANGDPATQTNQPAATQDFQDVPPTNPFFNFIRDIYFAGIVDGYPCGGVGEPCGPNSLPYYRPGALVTRQQMSKFVDLARRQPGIYIDTAVDGQPIFARTSVANGRAIEGDSVAGNGLHGVSSSNTASGVYGQNTTHGFGVAGRSTGTGSAVYGDNTNTGGWAGYFNGNVHVQGTCCDAAAGTYQIDDPLDPTNRNLNHSAVESPDMMNIYNGNVTLDAKGEATVQMPDYFQALNQDFRYQLTAIGAPGPNLYIAEEIVDNHFEIAGGQPGSKVSWQVTGIRHDPYAEQNRTQVEVDKPADQQGMYLHPEVYGQPDSKRIVPEAGK